MLAVRDGDIDQLSLLFERHNKYLFNFFVGMTGDRDRCEDMVQEVFVRMLAYKHTYRDDSRFQTWMFRIARNVRIDSFRKTRREKPLPEDWQLADPTPGPDESLMKNDEIDMLWRALAMLPEEKREVLLLSRFENLEFKEIARILQAKETTVKVRAHRAVKELGELYIKLTEECQS
jgi:RNA polymerase sigma-70 factor (ECF subfamily)